MTANPFETVAATLEQLAKKNGGVLAFTETFRTDQLTGFAFLFGNGVTLRLDIQPFAGIRPDETTANAMFDQRLGSLEPADIAAGVPVDVNPSTKPEDVH